MAGEVSTCLANQITLPEEDHPIPFDAASDVPIDDQKYVPAMESFRQDLRELIPLLFFFLINSGATAWYGFTRCSGMENTNMQLF